MPSDPRTATFLFTDLENSTPLWENHPALMQELAGRHDTLLREAIERHRGRVVKTTGDGFHAVFDSVGSALAAALAGQLAISGESWPEATGSLRVRMGLHTGESRERDGDFYGTDVNRAARIMGVGHGGQILISEATAALARRALPEQIALAPLGKHRLRGLSTPEEIFQLTHPDLPADFPPLKSLSVYRHNLPVQLSSFVGRKKELADIRRLLQNTHLLTLLGPGGTGKTRLMLEAAEELIGDFRHGVWLVELASLTDPDRIAERVAAALTLQEQPGRLNLETVVDFLRHKELLLLLDNVEHLVREAAGLVEQLLTSCPRLKILVTGREALFIGGETTLQIPSLSLPAANHQVKPEVMQLSEGVQLFLARARDVHPAYELTPANAAAVAEIVRRLDGIPLALELAAARLRLLTAEQIAVRLNDRFRLLTGGRRTALPRQQTLQALIDWSWNLLDEPEQLLLMRLSVFSGGWSLEAAQQVAADEHLDEYAVFDQLEQLVNKSLVTVSYPPAGEARYGMLESIRQYGRDRLFASGAGEALRDRHAAYFAAFAEEVGPHLITSTMLSWTERVTVELDNLRAALAWSVDDRPDVALRIAGNLLYIEAHWLLPKEAQAWLEPVVEKARSQLAAGDSRISMHAYIKALMGLAVAFGMQGLDGSGRPHLIEAIDLARQHQERRLVAMGLAYKNVVNPFRMTDEQIAEVLEAMEISQAHGYTRELSWTKGLYGLALYARGKIKEGTALLEEAAEVIRKIDNPRMDAILYNMQGFIAQLNGDFAAALDYYRLALEKYSLLKARRQMASARSQLGHLLRRQGALEEAEAYYRQAGTAWQEIGHLAAVAHTLECFAFIAIARGSYEHAARLIGAAGRAREQLNARSNDPREIADLAEAMARLGEAMGEAARDEAVAAGARLDLIETLERVLAGETL